KNCLVPVVVSCPPGLPIVTGGHCEYTLNIGIFFDGTNNNRDADMGKDAQSNVARLFDAYREDPNEGFFRHYISGVGTECKELGTSGKNPLEAAAGMGGQARILVGLLQVLNSVNFFTNDELLFELPQMAALCSEIWVRPDDPSSSMPIGKEAQILKELGLERGLVDDPNRGTFFAKLNSELTTKLADRKTPRKITGIYIDVFGFSRGAAQARTFTTWLHDYLLFGTDDNRTLFGIESYVRMLGIFDTVASVGNPADPYNNHMNWAEPKNLHIHPAVRNCVHFAAMHELRSSFPLDSVCKEDGTMPARCCERYYPGVHSDVGGGYAPNEQGKAISALPQIDASPKLEVKNKLKLSQLALNDMLAAARQACEFHTYGDPWLNFASESGKANRLAEQFDIDPLVASRVATYLSSCGIEEDLSIEDALKRHGELYLAWRYQVTQENEYKNLTSVGYASRLDAKGYDYLLKGESIFAAQLKFVVRSGVKDFQVDNENKGFSRRAADILAKIETKMVTVAAEIPTFFDDFVHDSYAGFIGKLGTALTSASEHEGYIRYRIVYTGTATPKNAMLGAPQLTRMA
ncbi:T6SS phospholipase effector Tle1-like catalytic domain-containing protein, partial [Collimonas silvisoli]|uniref:T6SS phospholipase effector Tle1-like catalytic domain-containing protein n=1 Tax=Collimonas silvisoli TaxID=2825884 RepID=UPI001B8C071D